MESALLTSEDVARYLNVEVITVRRLVQRGELAAYKIGGEFRFSRDDVDAYLERQYLPAQPDLLDSLGETATRDHLHHFTKRARHAFTFALDEARRLRHPQLGPEHLLLGLIRETEGVAGKALRDLGVTLESARYQVQALITPGKLPKSSSATVVLHNSVKEVLEHAVKESHQLQHTYVGTEHLLLGLLRDENIADILDNLNAPPEKVRESVIRLVTESK
jgi:excisionase family DNA binding protein